MSNDRSDESWLQRLNDTKYKGLFARQPDALKTIKGIVNEMAPIGWKGPADFDRFMESYGYGAAEIDTVVNQWSTKEFKWMGILGKYRSRGAFQDYDDQQPRTGPEQLPPYYNDVSNLPFLRTVFERVYSLYENAWTKFVGREPYVEFKQHFRTVRIRFNRIEAVVGAYGTPKPTITISEESTVATSFWGGLGMELPHDPQDRSMFQVQAYVLAGMEYLIRRIIDLHKSYLQIVIMNRPDPYQKYLIDDYSSLNKSLPALLDEWVHIWMGIFNRNKDTPLEALMSRLRNHVSTYNHSYRYTGDGQTYGILVSRPLIEAIRDNPRNREYWIVGSDKTGLRGQFPDIPKDSYTVRGTTILPMDKHWGQDDPDGSYLLQSHKEEYQAYFFPHPNDYLREGVPYPGGRCNFYMYDCQQRGWRAVSLNQWLAAQTFDDNDTIDGHMQKLATDETDAGTWETWKHNMFRVLSESMALRIGGRDWSWELALDTLRQAFSAERLIISSTGVAAGTVVDNYFGYTNKKLNDRRDQTAERIVLEACNAYDDFMGKMHTKLERQGVFGDTKLFHVLCHLEGEADLNLTVQGGAFATDVDLGRMTFAKSLKRAITLANGFNVPDVTFSKAAYAAAQRNIQIPGIEDAMGTNRDIKGMYKAFNRAHIPLPDMPVAIAPSVSLTDSAIFAATKAIIMAEGPFEIMPIRTIDKKHYVEVERNMGVRFDDPRDVLFMPDVHYNRALDHEAPQSQFMTAASLARIGPTYMPHGQLIAQSCSYNSSLSKETVFPIDGKLPDHYG